MSIFSFNWDINIVYIIFYWLIDIGFRLAMHLKYLKESRSFSEKEYITQLIYVFLLNISDLFSGFLVLYTKFVTKRERKDKIPLRKNRGSRGYSLIHEGINKYCRHKFLRNLILITILDYIANSLDTIAFAITKAKNENIYHQAQIDIVNTFDILMRYILSIFIQKMVVFRHRQFSIILIIIVFSILLFADFFFMHHFKDPDIKPEFTLIHIGINFIAIIFLPIKDILIQRIFNYNYLLPHQLMFLKSLVETIITIIIISILVPFSVSIFPLNLGIYNILAMIGYIIFVFFRSLIYLKIIYNLSAQSVSVLIIGKSLADLIVEIINYSTDDNKKTFLDIILLIMEFLVILIITFATLVYDEIIIIKKCNLDINTKKGIRNRLGDDLLQVIDNIRSSTEANLIETREGEIDIEES